MSIFTNKKPAIQKNLQYGMLTIALIYSPNTCIVVKYLTFIIKVKMTTNILITCTTQWKIASLMLHMMDEITSTVKIPHLRDYMCGGTNIYVAALWGTLLIVVLNLQWYFQCNYKCKKNAGAYNYYCKKVIQYNKNVYCPPRLSRSFTL